MGYSRTHLALATAAQADPDRFVTTTAMKVGTYTLQVAGAMPSEGARHVTCTRTVVAGGEPDTPGTIVITGKNLAGDTITETLIPGGTGVLVTGTKWFASIDAPVAPAGWVINGGNDTIVVGCGADVVAVDGSGTLHSVSVNTTAAGAITLADVSGTIAILKSDVVEGNYLYDVAFSGYLQVTLAAASDITVIHSPIKHYAA